MTGMFYWHMVTVYNPGHSPISGERPLYFHLQGGVAEHLAIGYNLQGHSAYAIFTISAILKNTPFTSQLIIVVLVTHSRYRGSVNCGAPSMENRFPVATFLFEVNFFVIMVCYLGKYWAIKFGKLAKVCKESSYTKGRAIDLPHILIIIN